jgi:hypothetical protein
MVNHGVAGDSENPGGKPGFPAIVTLKSADSFDHFRQSQYCQQVDPSRLFLQQYIRRSGKSITYFQQIIKRQALMRITNTHINVVMKTWPYKENRPPDC